MAETKNSLFYVPVPSRRFGRSLGMDLAVYLTFSGSGKPTLNSDIGVFINAAKKIADIPVALLTNGSILSSKDNKSFTEC